MSQNPEPIKTSTYDHLKAEVYQTSDQLGIAAALAAQEAILQASDERGEANIILATGNSQIVFLHHLREMGGIDWSQVNVFHMDEYLGMESDHPASFTRFLKEHLIDHVKPRRFFSIRGEAQDVKTICKEYEELLRQYPADLVVLGLGDTGHLAFNDPPFADFDDPVWVKVVKLDKVSRLQQVHQKHFQSLDQVPTHAITLTIPALMAGKWVLCLVPGVRKAEIVRACLGEPINEERPGSIMRRYDHCRIFLDVEAASRL